jgi:hypothetical protein
MDQKTNGQVLEEEFFQESGLPKTGCQDLDLDEYRAGKPLELAEITYGIGRYFAGRGAKA